MKVKFQVLKGTSCLCEGVYDVFDAESFGQACAGLWTQIEGQRLRNATSIGATYEALSENMLEELDGLHIAIAPLR